MSGHPEEMFTVEDVLAESMEDVALWDSDDTNPHAQADNAYFFAHRFRDHLVNLADAYRAGRVGYRSAERDA